MKRLIWLCAAICSLLPLPSLGEQLHIAVAANFLGTLQKLAPQFQRTSGIELVPSAGSSGQLLVQIQQGAPFDVFLSADAERARLLEQAGQALPASRFTYAIGTLVLWSAKPGLIDGAGRVLKSDRYRRLSLADPRNAPYGAAAQQVLTASGLWDRLQQQKRLVIGESITQAWQFVASGNAELGFVALSQVLAADGSISGSHWLPPQSMYQRIDQDAVILARTAHPVAAQAFTHWLRTDPSALATLKAAGYRTAD